MLLYVTERCRQHPPFFSISGQRHNSNLQRATSPRQRPNQISNTPSDRYATGPSRCRAQQLHLAWGKSSDFPPAGPEGLAEGGAPWYPFQGVDVACSTHGSSGPKFWNLSGQ
eukprot:2232931-Pyramimonas_sp.AAC.1